MKAASEHNSPTRLSDSQFEECVKIVRIYLKSKPFIRNQDIRAVASIGYDQAIYFFNRAIAEKRLLRKGKGAATRYILRTRKDTEG